VRTGHSPSSWQHVQQCEVTLLSDEPDPGLLPERLAEQGAKAIKRRMVAFEAENAIVPHEEHLHAIGIFLPD